MSAPELALRGRDTAVKLLWRRDWVREMHDDRSPVPVTPSVFRAVLPREVAAAVTDSARSRAIACADQLMTGRWKTFAVERSDVGPEPDWFTDPRTGRKGPASRYCFRIDHRREDVVGNIKYVWELSRHHHLTVLAAAYFLTGDDRYAVRVREHLTSWWHRNPFLSGVHWTSGIEVGVRLISWVWIRRLLDAWPAALDLFERNPVCLRQLQHHQRYLATLTSHSSSANNHVIAEAAGLFVASCAFPWFPQTEAWRARAATTLRREIGRQTFPCGLNRELATDYHALVLELSLAAALEGEAAGQPLGAESWGWLCRMTDVIAAMVDEQLRPPRQGDSDDGTALLLDDPGYDRWAALLATGDALFGALDWWPSGSRTRAPRTDRTGSPNASTDIRTTLWTALGLRAPIAMPPRPRHRPSLFTHAGMVILRDVRVRPADSASVQGEIWCRCDHGPLGFLSVAAHGHADALAVELRYGGVDVLADPGTYCYHGERAWRTYFRSTLAHNTLELEGTSQSVDGGPFLWLRRVPTRLIRADGLESGSSAVWEAEHRGYERLPRPAIHRRRVELDRERRTVTIVDRVESDGEHHCRLAFHLGPAVEADVRDRSVDLRWSTGSSDGKAAMQLPEEFEWTAVRGRLEPPLGWYSPAFDERQPVTTLLGTGRTGRGQPLRTVLAFG